MSTPAASRPSAFGSRPVLSAARAAAAALTAAGGETSRLWALSDAEVGAALDVLDDVRRAAEARQVAVVVEARSRGLGTVAGLGPVDWAIHAAPGLSTGHAATLQAVATACEDTRLADLAAAVESGAVSLRKAAQLARFHVAARGVADPAQLAADTAILIANAPHLTEKELAIAIRHTAALLRPEHDTEHLEARRRAARTLHKTAGPAGMSTYRLVLDPEGAAILDAAIDPLARPRRHSDGGGVDTTGVTASTRVTDSTGVTDDARRAGGVESDLRSAAARRADALLAIVGRGVSSPGETPKTARAAVVVTLDYATLAGQLTGSGGGCPDCGAAPTRPTGAALTLGRELLSPGTVRRLACEADIIPMVLGTDSEVLDVGRTRRLVPPAIRLAAWLRDAGCTYPGCTIPAQWCDAHHAIPWWSGGETSLANTALLCGRHHTLAHDRDLTCTITDTGVTWHL